MENGSRKRARVSNQKTQCVNTRPMSIPSFPSLSDSDPFAVAELLEDLDDNKYGSVTAEFEAIRAQNMCIFGRLSEMRSSYRLNPDHVGMSPKIGKDNAVSTPIHNFNLHEQPAEETAHVTDQHIVEAHSYTATVLNTNDGFSSPPCSFTDKDKMVSSLMHGFPSDVSVGSHNVTTSPKDRVSETQQENNNRQIIVIDSDDEIDPHLYPKCEADDNRLSQIAQQQQGVNVEPMKCDSDNGSYRDHVLHQMSGNATVDNGCAVKNIWQPAIQYPKVSLTNITEKNQPSTPIHNFNLHEQPAEETAHVTDKHIVEAHNYTATVLNTNDGFSTPPCSFTDKDKMVPSPMHGFPSDVSVGSQNVTTSPKDRVSETQQENNNRQLIVIVSDDEIDPHLYPKCEADNNRLSQIAQQQQRVNVEPMKCDSDNGSYRDHVLHQMSGNATVDNGCAVKNIWQPAIQYQKVSLTNITENNPPSDLVDENCETVFFPFKNLGTSKVHRVQKSSFQLLNSNVDNNNERKNENLQINSFPLSNSTRHLDKYSERVKEKNKKFCLPILSSTGNVDNNNEGGNENQRLKITKRRELHAFEGPLVDEYMGQESPTLELRSDFDSEASENDGLDDLWNEMSLAMECSKSASVDIPVSVKRVEEQECDHSFVLKDDLGLVCRICGIIQKCIEEIIDYQWSKASRTTRTYAATESRNPRNTDISFSFSGLKSLEHDLLVAEIAIHPKHQKKMRPHQLEGFNFLVRNLVSDKPGGCVLAHAPGSGKTFMLISFIQSFFGKYPFSRPLIILPKGILSTWKKEFKKWQVEEIPLLDFYSVKAEGRSQQLDVLKCWVENKSILFLGYKQFANIVCDNTETDAADACRVCLLKTPSLLIIDEGHTPRNDNTDVFHSLIRVQTPLKVVLSGTLFQNHVKEVFNILDFVRPKFLKMEGSRAVVRRILSRVQISGARKQCRADKPDVFYDLVEETLQDDENPKRKVTVIQDLREMTKEVLHYYKGDFLEELPGLVDFTVVLELSSKQKATLGKLGKMDKFRRSSLCSAIYMHPRLENIRENIGRDKVHVHDKTIDSILEGIFNVNDGVKTKFFLNILSMSESAGEKLLVFSHYLLPLRFLERLLAIRKGWRLGKEMFMISGDLNHEQRELAMERINNSDDAKILFGSIKACGEGISLVGASRVIVLDVHLNPSVSIQAIGRAFRPGQTKKVYVYRLVAADSSEEEGHKTSFRKEVMSKLWFEWNEFRDNIYFELETIDIKNSGDMFLENPYLAEDIKCLYKR